ncbi:hypothetical protein ACP8Y2_07075 [Herpetosiphon llansteffanensis]
MTNLRHIANMIDSITLSSEFEGVVMVFNCHSEPDENDIYYGFDNAQFQNHNIVSNLSDIDFGISKEYRNITKSEV